MKYTKNYQFKKPDSDDAYDIQNDFYYGLYHVDINEIKQNFA
jgi:hypothetical protein